MVRCRSIFLLDGGGSFFSDVCDCQGDKLYAADDDGQQQGIDDQQDQPYCVEYTGYKCVFCHVFWPPFPHNMVFLSSELCNSSDRYSFFAEPALSWARGPCPRKCRLFLKFCYYFRKFGGFFPSTEVTFALQSLHFCNGSSLNQSIFRIISRILRAQSRISSFVI